MAFLKISYSLLLFCTFVFFIVANSTALALVSLYHELAVHGRDLHSLRSAVLLYLELAVHDRDLHSLRMAVLLYHKSAIYDRDLHMLRMAVLLYLEKRLFTILFEEIMI